MASNTNNTGNTSKSSAKPSSQESSSQIDSPTSRRVTPLKKKALLQFDELVKEAKRRAKLMEQ